LKHVEAEQKSSSVSIKEKHLHPSQAEIFWRLCLLAYQKEFLLKKDLTLTIYALDRPCFMFDFDREVSVLHLMDFLQINSQGLDLLYCRSIF